MTDPTLRECGELLQTVSVWGRVPCSIATPPLPWVKIHKLARRLTDEALERDEKRKVALLRLFYRSQGQHMNSSGNFIHDIGCIICEAVKTCMEARVEVFAEPYALPPDPKEEE